MTNRPEPAAAIAAAQERAAKRSGQVDRVSVITFRVTPQERTVLDMVASRQGETLSAFVRFSALAVAQGIIDDEGGVEEFARRYGRDQNAHTVQMIEAMLTATGGPAQRGSAD